MSVVLKRKIDIGNREFMVFGKAPWMTLSVEAIDKTPACVIIIESSLMAFVMRTHYSKHKFNALSSIGTGGVNIPVAFVGEDGAAKAKEIVKQLNFKLG